MIAARVALAGMVIASVVGGWLCHGRPQRVNGWMTAGITGVEAVLIYFAGGWS